MWVSDKILQKNSQQIFLFQASFWIENKLQYKFKRKL